MVVTLKSTAIRTETVDGYRAVAVAVEAVVVVAEDHLKEIDTEIDCEMQNPNLKFVIATGRD